jgi:hypothetical protein
MIEVSDILRRHVGEYLVKYGSNIPANHLKVIHDMLRCRTSSNGGTTWYCKECRTYIYSYHSCGNRNCNKCQNELIEHWFEKARESLLPVNHFLVTFTIPESLRLLARANQKLFYSLLFKAATTSLQTLGWDTRFAGGTLGMIGVLHTWSRTLVYHPHVHFIVTCGGWFEDENIWLPCKKKFLVPVKALSKIFRAKFRDYLRTKDPAIFTTINQKVWKNKWIVHSQAVGSGEDALKYLSQYVFKPAISNKRILSLEEGVVTFKYQNSNAKEWKIMKLDSLAFIRRYLMHVLPRGFVKVRYFGIYAHASHKKLQKVKMTLNTTVAQISSKLKSECPNYENQTAETKMICPKCHQHVVFIKRKNKPACMAYYPKAPPAKERMIHANQIFLR